MNETKRNILIFIYHYQHYQSTISSSLPLLPSTRLLSKTFLKWIDFHSIKYVFFDFRYRFVSLYILRFFFFFFCFSIFNDRHVLGKIKLLWFLKWYVSTFGYLTGWLAVVNVGIWFWIIRLSSKHFVTFIPIIENGYCIQIVWSAVCLFACLSIMVPFAHT